MQLNGIMNCKLMVVVSIALLLCHFSKVLFKASAIWTKFALIRITALQHSKEDLLNTMSMSSSSNKQLRDMISLTNPDGALPIIRILTNPMKYLTSQWRKNFVHLQQHAHQVPV